MTKKSGTSPFLENVHAVMHVRHPSEPGELEVAPFSTHLAVKGRVAAANQNQARNVLVFAYGVVHKRPLDQVIDHDQQTLTK